MAQMAVYCLTPKGHCIGSMRKVADGLGLRLSHGSHEDAFRCYRRYLLGQGYTQLGPREFAAPDNGPIMVLTKRSRFGARLRKGKEGRYMARGLPGGCCIG